MVCALSIASRVSPRERNSPGKFPALRRLRGWQILPQNRSRCEIRGDAIFDEIYSRIRQWKFLEEARENEGGEGSLDMVVNVRFSDTQVALQVAESWVIYSWLRAGNALLVDCVVA